MTISTVQPDGHDPRGWSRPPSGPAVVWLTGEHDRSTSEALASEVEAASAASGGDVVLDLSGVEFMDAATIGVIARARDLLGGQSRRLSLRAPSPCARRLVELCDLTALWAVEQRPGAELLPVSNAPTSRPIQLGGVERSPGMTRLVWTRLLEQPDVLDREGP